MNSETISISGFNYNNLKISFLINNLTNYKLINIELDKDIMYLGEKNCPKYMCTFFKYILAQNIEALNNGIKILINREIRCKNNYFYEYQKKILSDMNYDFELYTIDDNPINIYKKLKILNPNLNILKFIYFYIMSLLISKYIQKYETKIKMNIGYEIIEGSYERIKKSMKINILKSKNIFNLFKKFIKYKKKFKAVLVDKPKKCKKILLIENSPSLITNYKIEKNLSKSNMQVIYYNEFGYTSLIDRIISNLNVIKIRKYCKNKTYNNDIIIDKMLKKKIDGIIHIKPHNCLLEVARMQIFNSIAKSKKIPILFLSSDYYLDNEIEKRLEIFQNIIKMNK